MTISIDYQLVGTGWSRCSVILDGERAEITGSYLSDCLRGLADCALQLLGGATSALTTFDEEPGEYRWVMEELGGRLHIRILEFEELWGKRPDSDGEVVLAGCCDRIDFVSAVRDMLQRVLDEHGAAGYKDRWVEHEFPSAQLRVLSEGLSKMGSGGQVSEVSMNASIPAGTEMARPFLPARDFDLSKRFYEALGFTKVLDDEVAIFRIGASGFVLQNHFQKDWAENFMMQLMVDDLDAWWKHDSHRD